MFIFAINDSTNYKRIRIMDINTLSKIKLNFVAREVGDELVVVPLSGNVAQMNELFTLNETGKFIWENVVEGRSVDELAVLMTECFEIDKATAERDVDAFLVKMDMLEKYNR